MKGTHIGEFEELVLLLVSILQDDSGAYVLRIQGELKSQLNRSVSMGALHTTLTRLENKGLLDSEMSGASTKRGGRRKRVYSITTSGVRALQQVKEARRMLWNQVPEFVLKLNNA